MKSKILLLGGSGTLGRSIINSKLFKNLKFPRSNKLNILKQKELKRYIFKNDIKLIMHFAAFSRVKQCEKNKNKAYKINVIGTGNVVKAIKNSKKKIKLVFMSSDAVYPSTKGNYKESDKLKPYNYYGLTKIIGEQLVKLTKNYVIIRGRFFNKNKIPFRNSASNIFTSSLEVKDFVKQIYKIISKNFNGTINIGGPKISDYKKYSKYKKNLKPCDKSIIFKNLNVKLASDASLNLDKLKKLK